jgi:thioesterase domain-containing protein/acyl carrier protein
VRAGSPEQVLYRTGDLGRFGPDGAIEFVGRTDRQIKLRGFRIELEEIEAHLERHPDVRQVAVTVRAEPAADKSIVAFVALRRPLSAPVDELRAFLSTRVPGYMVPSTFVVLDALPLTASGKIDRAALPEPPSVTAAGDRTPRTETQHRLAVIWADVLGAEPLSLDENFFDAGGHSLLAMRVIARIESEFGVTLPVSTLFHSPTIGDLARTLAASHSIGRRVLVPMQPGGNRPPLVLVHALGGEVWPYVPLARRLAPDQPCFGLQLPDFEEGETFPTIEELATRYVDALIKDVPGPYTLAGYSSGAAIAFEMAHQLKEHGRSVLLLIALDAGLPNRGSSPSRLIKATGMMRNIPWWIRYDLIETPPAQMADRLRRKLSHAASVTAQRLRRTPSSGDSRGFDLRDERGVRVPWGPHRSSHYAAVMAYRPRRYEGRVAVLKARARPLFGTPEHDLGWSRMVSGPVDVSWIPGSHETFLREPHVREVARHIRLGIDAALKG